MVQPTSGRYDGDTWDLASGVGATATMVAASRAIASRDDRRLIDDPFAAPLVKAVGVEFFTRLADGDLTSADLDEPGADPADPLSASLDSMTSTMAVRTRFFDQLFLDATGSGIRQAVILASGLDSRAYRLPWPAGTTVYEIDQPQVIEFKTATLAGLGATPTASRRALGVDLRADWAGALRAAGFDSAQPSVWSAEGLLGYLPPAGQDTLLDTVTALSAPGSRFGCESVPNIGDVDTEELRQRMASAAERWRRHGLEMDVESLVYGGDRADASVYLADRGWTIAKASSAQLAVDYGISAISVSTDGAPGWAGVLYLDGTL